MMVLLRNCAHGSEVATYVRGGNGGRMFVKVALTAEGRDALRSELAGWSWYQSARNAGGPPMCRALRDDRHVVRIAIAGISGRAGRAADGVQRNALLIGRAIGQYCDLWPRGESLAPMHGEFSCDNFIDGAGGLVVIDWEHFRPAAAPWGFDAAYLLAEAIYFERQRGSGGDRNAAVFAADQLRRLASRGPLGDEMRRAPVRFVTTFIRAHAGFWRGELARNPMKLPVLSWSDAEVDAIDRAIAAAGDRQA